MNNSNGAKYDTLSDETLYRCAGKCSCKYEGPAARTTYDLIQKVSSVEQKNLMVGLLPTHRELHAMYSSGPGWHRG